MKNLSDQLKAIRIKPLKERPLVARDHSVPVNDLGINKIPTPLEIYEYFNKPSNGVADVQPSDGGERLATILHQQEESTPVFKRVVVSKNKDYTHGPVRVFTDQEIKERNDE